MTRPSRRSRSRRAPAQGSSGARSDEARATPRPFSGGALAIALLALIVYIPGLRNGFVYDAEVLVENDPRVHTLENPVSLLGQSYWPFGEERMALYRPLVTLSFATDWAMHDGAPWGFHLTNALLHAGVSVLVLLLLSGFASTPAALAGAALFAVHPLQVEAVASIVGRGDILAAGLSFAALLAWSRLPPRGAALLLTVPTLFLLALGSKESAIMLPALLVLFDAATGRLRPGGMRDWTRERAWPLMALALVALAYLAARVTVLGGVAPQSLNPIMAVTPLGATRVRTALQIWPEILRLLFLPRVLLADYSPRILMPAVTWTPRALAGLALLGVSVIGGLYALVRERGRVGLILLWVPVALLPVSNLILPIGVLLAERTLYVAVFALALGVAVAIDALGTGGRRRHVALILCGIVCTLFATRTVLRLPSWRTTDEVFRTLLRDRPDSYRAHWHHARMAWRDGDLPSALAYYQSTIELWPQARPVFGEAGMFATETGQQREARSFAEQGLEQWPDDPALLRRLAVACLNLNDTTAARAAVERGLKVVPDDPLLTAMREAIGVSVPH
ncbi:MAG: tetratricopeptide repeat protein [Gemmatimonadales bacterium]|nr:MAG: tetratricopeptide repeat protein [Gemmatimonadales bacterium]